MGKVGIRKKRRRFNQMNRIKTNHKIEKTTQKQMKKYILQIIQIQILQKGTKAGIHKKRKLVKTKYWEDYIRIENKFR